MIQVLLSFAYIEQQLKEETGRLQALVTNWRQELSKQFKLVTGTVFSFWFVKRLFSLYNK